jgi:multiple sugar transport system ATP-binding protein
MASVTYDHVWKKFGDVEVLKDIQLAINDKEFLVLVGPSGCGKSPHYDVSRDLKKLHPVKY